MTLVGVFSEHQPGLFILVCTVLEDAFIMLELCVQHQGKSNNDSN